ncbi:4757_t:CDS:2 [Paraglomus brasilianum]|uniref:H/ACA ribonucleoprotein complex non-core subunit NAF1 n=1 Tax=Paraglomus brasilianum TaxID=144538 RepID=A0A9N8WEI1_9GLOM|nr:4757_t:CDS:2 [Paraglomus brasilianum]
MDAPKDEKNGQQDLVVSLSEGDSSETSFASDSDTDNTNETEVSDLYAEAVTNGEILRTRNEIANIPITKPNIEVKDDMPIDEIGSVYNIVENAVTVIAKVSGEYQVLDSGSIFVFEDRQLLGEVSETFGPVSQPMYVVLFDIASEIDLERVKTGTKIYSVRQYANYVFTRPLREQKGSDASNFFDEEPNESEMEFSDDEKEAEYKSQLKKSNNPGRGSSKSRGRGRRSSQTRNDRPPLKLEDDPQTRNDPPMLKVEDDPYGYNILRRPQQTPPTSVTQTYNVAHSVGPASSTHSIRPTLSYAVAPSVVQSPWPAVNSPSIMTHPPIQPHVTQPQSWQTQIHPQMQHGFQYQQAATTNVPPAHVDIRAIPQQQHSVWNQEAYDQQVNNFGNASGFHPQ